MLGMDFIGFVILLVISAIVSAILHYGVKFYVVAGTSSFLCKVVVGWVGAWLGSPVLGHWWDGLNYEQVYFVPAILGSLAFLVLAVDGVNTAVKVFEGPSAGSEQQSEDRPTT